MCLISEKGKPIKCRKNLKCYKVFRVEYGSERKFDHFYGPITNRELPKSGVITDYVYVAEGDKKPVIYSARELYLVDEGYIHSFMNIEDAERCIKKYYFGRNNTYVIYECVIPKGTEYFRGGTGSFHAYNGFASKAIRIGKQIGETIYVSKD